MAPSTIQRNGRATAQSGDDKVALIGAYCVVNVIG
jgi:hypothetical protein